MVTPTPPPRATPSSRYCAKTRDLICDLNHNLNHKTNRLILPARRFPPPWSVEKQQTCGPVCSRCYQVNVPTHLRNDDGLLFADAVSDSKAQHKYDQNC